MLCHQLGEGYRSQVVSLKEQLKTERTIAATRERALEAQLLSAHAEAEDARAAGAASQRQCEEERRSVNERAAEAVAKEHEDRRIEAENSKQDDGDACLLYTSPSPRDKRQSRMPSSA